MKYKVGDIVILTVADDFLCLEKGRKGVIVNSKEKRKDRYLVDFHTKYKDKYWFEEQELILDLSERIKRVINEI